MPETLSIYDHELTREPNMNTIDTRQLNEHGELTDSYEDRQYRIFMRWLVTLAVLIVTATACYCMSGCTPDDYPGDPEASVAHSEQGQIGVGRSK